MQSHPTVADTVRSRYKRLLIRLNMNKKWPTRTGMEDSRPIFFCKRFSYNENALYTVKHSKARRCFQCLEAPRHFGPPSQMTIPEPVGVTRPRHFCMPWATEMAYLTSVT